MLHDVVLAPLVILAVAWSARAGCPRPWRAPAVVALVVLGSVTLLAVPVLGRFGARPDNPTLLDRHYVAGWLGLLALVVAGRCSWSRRLAAATRRSTQTEEEAMARVLVVDDDPPCARWW